MENLQSLIQQKEKVTKLIADLDEKKQQIKSKLAVLSLDKNIDVKIKELEIDRTKLELKKVYEEVSTKIKFISKIITEEEANNLNQFNSTNIDEEIRNINDNIAKLREQKQQNNKFKQINDIQKFNKRELQLKLKDINRKIANNFKNQLKSAVSYGGRQAVISAISMLVTSQLSRLSKEVGNLEVLVDNVNDFIVNIKTKEDLEKARTLRNAAVRLLNSCQNKLIRIKKIIDRITKILRTLNRIVRLLTKVALLPGAPKALLFLLVILSEVISAIITILQSSSNVIRTLIDKIEELKRRLKEIGNILDNFILNGDINKLTDIAKLSSDYGKLGILNTTYNGFRFAIKEENNPKFVVQGFKRRYAVALNRDGNEVLKSEFSFTLDPDVLIQELILEIDEKELKP